MHEHLNKLRIISKIRASQRLDTTNGLTVYEESIYNWFLRKYYHDNKDEGTRYLQDLYRSIDQSVEQLTNDIRRMKDENKKIRKIHIAINLAEKIKLSVYGVENLAKTYAPYPKTTATLEGVIQDFAVVTYTQLLEVIPKERISKLLKENITYNGIILYLGMNSYLNSRNIVNDINNTYNISTSDNEEDDNEINLINDKE